jgi:hypothetical protein
MWQHLQPTVETAIRILIIGVPVIFVLWLASKLLGDSVSDFFAGFAKEIKQFSILKPEPSAINLIGGVAMFAALMYFSRSIESEIFSPSPTSGELSLSDIGMAMGGAFLIGTYFLLCIRANR